MEQRERELLKLTKEEAQDIVWGDYDPNIYEVVSQKITNTGRWSGRYEIIIKRLSDEKYFKDYYSTGLTEQQDEGPYEYTEPNFGEVFPELVTTIKYV